MPWERELSGTVMLRLVDDTQGKFIPFSTIIELSYGAPVEQVFITCAERLIRTTGSGLQHLVTAVQRGEVNVIQVWEPTDHADTSVILEPSVTHVSVAR